MTYDLISSNLQNPIHCFMNFSLLKNEQGGHILAWYIVKHHTPIQTVLYTYLEFPVACLCSESKTGTHFKILTSCFQIHPVCFLINCSSVNTVSNKLHLDACVELQH